MATVTLNATDSLAVTITLASLANTSFATSSALDNSASLYLSANVQVKVKSGASGVSATGFVNLYLLRSADGGTTYDDNNKVMIGSLAVIANATTYVATFSTEPYGQLGTKWKVAIENRSGAALDTTAGNHSVNYTGCKLDVA